jgi:protocatechuate 3,4-dioxygenase beta subunit
MVAALTAWLTAVVLPPQVAAAQTTSLSGTVADETGGAVEGARVDLRGASGGAGRTVRTGRDGRYRFDALPPGEYILKISADRFQTADGRSRSQAARRRRRTCGWTWRD